MEVFCLKLLVFLLCTCISVVLRVGWGWFPATLLLLLCRKCVEKTRVPVFSSSFSPSPDLSFIEECFCNHIVGGACCCTHHHRCCCCRLLKVRTFVNSSGKLNGRGHECERPAFRFECNRWWQPQWHIAWFEPTIQCVCILSWHRWLAKVN